MNEKYKLIFTDANGGDKTITENHPNLNSSAEDKEGAMEAIGAVMNYNPVRIDLQSDTTVWVAD